MNESSENIQKIRQGPKNNYNLKSHWKQYKFTVITDTNPNAGTKAKISFQIIGDRKILPPFCFPHKKSEPREFFEFGVGSSNFVIIRSEDLRAIKSIKITNHGKTKNDGWKLNSIAVKDLSTKKSWTFPSSDWIVPYSLGWDLHQRLYPAKSTFAGYDITVFTGNQGDSENKIIFIQLFGTAGTSGEVTLVKPDVHCFKKGSVDAFHTVIYDIGIVNKIKIGLTSTTRLSTWYLKQIEIASLQYRKSMVFPCYQCFEANQETVCMTLNGKNKSKRLKSTYLFTVYSKPLESCHSDGFFCAVLVNPAGSSDRIILSKSLDCFTEKCINKFKVRTTRVDNITSLMLFHDAARVKLWIDKIVVEDEIFDKCYESVFFDYMESSVEYRLDAVYWDAPKTTKKVVYHIFLNIGSALSSEKMPDLDLELIGGTETMTTTENIRLAKNKIYLQRSNHFKANFDPGLDIVKSILIKWTDSEETAPFYLENVKIVNSISGVAQLFQHEKMLDSNVVLSEDVKQREITYAEGIAVDLWQLILFAKQNVSETTFKMILFGSTGVSGVICTPKITLKSEFTETITFESLKIGHLHKLRIWQESKACVFSKITIGNLITGHFYVFHIDSWFKRNNPADHSDFIELPAEGPVVSSLTEFVEYAVKLKVKHRSKERPKIMIEIIGGNKDSTGERIFACQPMASDQGLEEYRFSALSVGQIEGLRIGHKDCESSAEWFLESVRVECLDLDQDEEFICNRWFSQRKEDGMCVRTLNPGENPIPANMEYEVCVVANKLTAPSSSTPIYIIFIGTDGQTRKMQLEKSSVTKKTHDLKNKYTFTCQSVGLLLAIRIGSTPESAATPWKFDCVKVKLHEQPYYFYPDKTITKKCPEIEVKKSKTKKAIIPDVEYKIIVYTGDKLGAGTDSNVFMNIYGNRDVVHNVKLTNEQFGNKFERGKHDVFTKILTDVGLIQKIDLMHDSFGLRDDWYVDKVEIISSTKMYCFQCEQWIKKTKGLKMALATFSPNQDEAVSVHQNSAESVYSVTIYTGSQFLSGTSASVFITIYGENGKTEPINLSSKASTRPTATPFSRNSIDVFNVKNCDVGVINKIKLMHSATGIGADWFVKKLEILHKNNKYNFIVDKWIGFDNTSKEASVEIIYEK